MNLSKSHPNSRCWKIWASAGAVDNTLRARQMGSAIFNYDPFISCPFDDSEMKMVEESGGLKIGGRVTFRGSKRLGTVRGRVIAIGENARYLNGDPFTALAIKSGKMIYFKTDKEVEVK